jgi:hypothetical protein
VGGRQQQQAEGGGNRYVVSPPVRCAVGLAGLGAYVLQQQQQRRRRRQQPEGRQQADRECLFRGVSKSLTDMSA